MNVVEYLDNIVNLKLHYAIKSPGLDLYDFGFGDDDQASARQDTLPAESCTCFIHAVCRVDVIWRNKERRVDRYDRDTPCEIFHSEIRQLTGLRVRKAVLRDKNDLLLDFGECWVVFVVFDDREESWRFFSSDRQMPHLVASGCGVDFVY